MQTRTKRVGVLVFLSASLLAASGCNRQEKEKEAIRASIVQHATSRASLRMDAMDVNLKQVEMNGGHANALAEFHPKQAPSSVVFQMKYQLEKRDGSWVVLSGQPAGGEMSHPTPDQMPPGHPDVPSSLPPGHPALPAGHPPLRPPSQTQAAKPH